MDMDERTSHPVIIVGGGVAGLTAALHLAERGLAPLVLEADPAYCGGRLQGGPPTEVTHAGRTWRFPEDHGVHGIWSQYRNLNAMLTRHQLRPVLVPAQQETWIYRGRRMQRAIIGDALRYSWMPAPFHALAFLIRPRFLGMLRPRDVLALPAVLTTLLVALAIDPLRESQPLEGMTLPDLTVGWSPRFEALFAGLARNGSAADPADVPAAGFIAFLRFYTLLRRDAWAFSYFPADSGSALIAPWAARISALGGQVRRDARVTRLTRAGEDWRVTWESQAGEVQEATARRVIVAADAPHNRELLRESQDTAARAADLRWPTGVPVGIVRLWFDRAPRPGAEAGIFSGDFILDNFFWLHRLQDPFVRWHRATGGSAIESHIYGPQAWLERPDAALLAHAAQDIERAYPELRGHRLHATLRRNDPTHTLSKFGATDDHLGIETPWPGLFCCGDWVRHPTPALYLERACVTGIAAANAVLRASEREPWPLLEHLPPEPLARIVERDMRAIRGALRRVRR